MDKRKIAIYAGSFDPFTIGHASIVEKALDVFDELIITVAHNPDKKRMFTVDEITTGLYLLYKDNPRISIASASGLIADFARETGAGHLVRGVRNAVDFEYERNMAEINKNVFGIETVLLFANLDKSFVSSSMVRELIRHGKDASEYIAIETESDGGD